MIILQSYLSQEKNNQGWHSLKNNLFSWVVSFFQAKEFYDEINLVTDNNGKNTLIDFLELPYTKILNVLDEYDFNKQIWSYGKIIAYSLQDKPFIHIDSDVYLWNKFPDYIENADIAYERLEPAHHYYYKDAREALLNNLSILPECYKKEASAAINCGIFGGNNIKAIKKYTNYARMIVEHPLNKEGWKKISEKEHLGNYCCTIEQQLAWSVFYNEKIKMYPLLWYGWKQDDAKKIGYTHVGAAKKDKIDIFFNENFDKRMKDKYHKYWNKINELQ